MKTPILLLLWIVLGLCYAQAQTPTETFQFTDEFSVITNPKVNMDFQTSVVSHKGNIYFGFVDAALNGCISKKDKNGTVTTTVVVRSVLEDPHNSVSIGIDAEGYIHWTGDMHQDAMKYFRSDKPEDISTFSQLDGNIANGGMWGPHGVSYGRFIQSRKGTLFFISRQRLGTNSDGWVPGGQGGHIQVYNTDTKRWNQLGSLGYSFQSDKGRTITGGMDNLHQTKAIFWDNSGAGVPPNNGYQGYKIRVVFDKNNRLHMVWNVAKNPIRTTVSDTHTHLMYAYSDDEGLTWKKSDGTSLNLPITTETGDVVYMEDPNVDAQRMFNGCYIALTSDNKPIICQWSYSRNLLVFKYNGSSWSNESSVWNLGWPGEAFTDDNGWITTMDGSRWKRSNDDGKTLQAYERVSPSRGAPIHSLDYQFLLETGKLRYVEETATTTTIRTLAFNNSAPGQVEAPEITPISGSAIAGSATVTISCSVPDAVIRYTTDGTVPTETKGILYTSPFSLTAATVGPKTVRAIAFKSGKVSSRVASAQIILNLNLDTQAPTVPTGLVATGISFTGFTLNWNPSSDNSGLPPTYEIYEGTTLIGTTATTSFTLTGLRPATSYALTVKAKDAAMPPNVSAASAVLDVMTNSTEATILLASTSPTLDGIKDHVYKSPTYPCNNVCAGTVSNKNDLDASWTSTYDKDNLYFFVEVTDNNINTTAANWYENDGVEFYIDATNRRGTSYQNTDFQFAYTFGDSQLRERNRNASTTGSEIVKINTSTGYRLEVKIPFSVLGITVTTMSQKIGLDIMVIDNDNGKWEGKLAWFNTQDNSWQNPSRFGLATLSSPDNDPPSVPTGLIATGIAQNSFTLTWNASTDNSGLPPTYQVFLGGTLLATTNNTSIKLSNLEPATVYAVTVKAKDAAGNTSAASAIFTVTTLSPDTQAPTIPTGLVASSVSPTGFVLSWNPSTDNVGVTAYEVFGNNVLLGTTATTTMTFTGLLSGSKYSMSVKAKDAVGNTSAASTVLDVNTAVITGLTSIGGSQVLRLFPNPALAYEGIYVLVEGFDQRPVTLMVTDLLGNIRTAVNIIENRPTALKVDTLSSGVYLVQVSNGVTKLVQKLVIR